MSKVFKNKKKSTIMKLYTAQLHQENPEQNPIATIFNNSLEAGDWVKDSVGIYLCVTNTNWVDNKIYVPDFSFSSGNGSFFPIYDNGGNQAGRIMISVFNDGGKVCFNLYIKNSENNFQELYDLLGQLGYGVKLSFPEIRMYE